MKFTLEIELGNEACRTRAHLVAKLKEVARRVSEGAPGRKLAHGESGRVRDVNGNTVGQWFFEEE